MSEDQNLQTVREWMQSRGRPPTGLEVRTAIGLLLLEWNEQKFDGMDIVADSILDEVVEIIEAIRDL